MACSHPRLGIACGNVRTVMGSGLRLYAQALARARSAAALQSPAASLSQLAAAAATSAALHAGCGAAAWGVHLALQSPSAGLSRAQAGVRTALAAAFVSCVAALALRRRPAPAGRAAGASGDGARQWHAAVLLGMLCAGLAAVACLNWPAAVAAALLAGPAAAWCMSPRRSSIVSGLAACGVAWAARGWSVLGAKVELQGLAAGCSRLIFFWVVCLVCLPAWLHSLFVGLCYP